MSSAIGNEVVKVERRAAKPIAGAIAGVLCAVLFSVYILAARLAWGRPAAPAAAPLAQTDAAVRYQRATQTRPAGYCRSHPRRGMGRDD